LTPALILNIILAMKWKLGIAFGFLITVILPVFPAPKVHADSLAPSSKVIISEIKLGGDSYSQGANQPKDPQEFITLYNQSGIDIDLTGWVIEYAKTTFDKTYCSDSNWMSHSVSGSVSQTVLNGTLKAGQASTPVARSLTDNASGAIHLVDLSDKTNPVIHDLVGWGASSPCFEAAAATTPSNGKSIKRFLDCNSTPIDSGDNSKDFAANQPPSPVTLNYPFLNICQDDSLPAAPDASQPPLTCEAAEISEILPNPSGTDTGNEYIELYNPTSGIVSLLGCSLQTSGGSKVFNLTSSLQPGEFHAFYSNETGLTLPNASGGTVWLLSPTTELQAVTYQTDLDDDISWTLVNNSWQASFQPTPNAANVFLATKPCPEGEERNPDTGYCRNIAALTTSNLSACPAVQERNPETNRCRATTTASAGLTPCKEGQTRNPATNRCVSTSSSSSALATCKAGQERNPQTNRCKAMATTTSAALKPCPAGQERNPSTNRCRKVTSGSGSKLASVKDMTTGSLANSPHWWLAGFAAVGATSYGVYEWRQEVLQTLSRIKTKIPGISSK
jgi:hypothetical protein